MTRDPIGSAAWVLLAALLVGCGSDGATETSATSSGAAGTEASSTAATGAGVGGAGAGGGGSVGGGPTGSGGGSAGAPACDDAKGLIEAYKAAHPGNGGQDGDINAKTPAEIAADADAQKLMALCGNDQRPVIPLLAWEYGGSDHAWIKPEASALFYCVYIPVNPSTDHWQYDAAADHVTADVYIGCPDQNPCKDKVGAEQVLACLGDDTNIEIIVDLASLNDGTDVGLSLSEATTDLNLIVEGGTKVPLYMGL